jgi:hypothetical protein
MLAARAALAAGDTALASAAFRALLADADDPHADSAAALARAAAHRFGPRQAIAFLDLEASAWPAITRDTLFLVHAELLALAGDTAAAVATALRAADGLGGAAGDHARVRAARWRLRGAAAPHDLADVRTLLLPAVASGEAQSLLEQLRVLDALLDAAGEDGDPLALFAAGEIARDALDAPALARSIFLDYAARAPDAVWAPKALLAAAALGGADDAIGAALARLPGNVYVAAVAGRVDETAFVAAEDALARSLTEIRLAAATSAGGRDPTVGRAVAVLDSLRAAEHADSIRTGCTGMIASLALAGVRADSAKAACVRGDAARVDAVLRMDTLLLRDTTLVRRAGGAPVTDTLRTPRP